MTWSAKLDATVRRFTDWLEAPTNFNGVDVAAWEVDVTTGSEAVDPLDNPGTPLSVPLSLYCICKSEPPGTGSPTHLITPWCVETRTDIPVPVSGVFDGRVYVVVEVPANTNPK